MNVAASASGAENTPVGTGRAPTFANRLGLDYRREAARLGPPPVPIIDVHTHVNGRGEHGRPGAAAIFRDVCDLYGVARVYTQTRLEDAEAVRQVFGERVRFIAVPAWELPDKREAFGAGFLRNIEAFRTRFDARIVKFWSAPRLRDILAGPAGIDLVELDSPGRIAAAELAESLGMMFMVHIADPDTWFRTKYANASVYRTKAEQYIPLERMLDRFTSPWIAAHMGGWPEDLSFLDGLLERHPNLYLDTSATKWIVREMSLHPTERVRAFFSRWSGRLLFGSDVVTTDEHLKPKADPKAHPMGELAHGPEEAFELYASRYWALRTLWETGYHGESTIADPDLMMVDPQRFDAMSAPTLRGHALPPDVLRTLYAGAAEHLLGRWERGEF